MDVEVIAIPGCVVLIMAVQSFTDIQVLGTCGSIDPDRLKDLASCNDRVSSFLIDVYCSDLGCHFGLEFGILGC
jgi:hypothetical protein